MTSKERVLTALRGEKPDKVPFIELSVNNIFAGEPYTYENIVNILGLDGYGERIYPKIYVNTKRDSEGRDIIVGGKITGSADMHMVDPGDAWKDERNFDHFRRMVDAIGADKFTFGATNIGLDPMLLNFGMDNFAYTLMDEPQVVEQMLDIYTEWTIRTVEQIEKTGVDAIWFTDDIAFNTSLMFSPEFFREICKPRMKKVMDSCNLPVIYHSDGNISEVIPDLIDIGINAIHPNEPGAMDIVENKKRFKNQICLIGNLDLRSTLVTSPVEDVEKEVFYLLENVGEHGGYIMSSSNSIADYCKLENVKAIRPAIEKYYALKK